VALRMFSMAELRMEVLLEPELTGATVTEVCRRREISRDRFYEYRVTRSRRRRNVPDSCVTNVFRIPFQATLAQDERCSRLCRVGVSGYEAWQS
jgi:hypothetical protein